MKETTIEQRAVARARPLGWEGIKVGTEKWPDRVFCGHGQAIWVEFKLPGEQPDPMQQKRIEQLWELGLEAYVMTSVEETLQLLERKMKRRA